MLGYVPDIRTHLSGDGRDHHVAMFTSVLQSLIAFAKPKLGVPSDLTNFGRYTFLSFLYLGGHSSGVAIGVCAFD